MDLSSILKNKKYKIIVILFSLFFSIIIYYLDFITIFEVNFSIFYVMPCFLITWFFSLKEGLFYSILATILWILPDNYIVTLSFFFLLTYLFDRIKKLLIREQTLSKLNSEMVSLISHEFNNLLTGIHLSSSLLEEDEGPNIKEEREKLYRVLNQNYTTMMQDINVFLNKSRLESGKLKLNIKKTEITQIINKIIEMLYPLIYEKNLNIIKNFEENDTFVYCDPDAISLVLSNILSNAIKYSPKNTEILISLKEKDNNFLEVSVKDSGIGIDKKDFNNIFSGFYRTKESLKHTKGFGIGLKVSKEILKLHNSDINIESSLNNGSKFYFDLPKE